MEKAAEKAAGDRFTVDSVRVFDVFTGKGVESGMKSVACAIRFRSDERTLKDKEVNAAFDEIQVILADTTDYTLRA